MNTAKDIVKADKEIQDILDREGMRDPASDLLRQYFRECDRGCGEEFVAALIGRVLQARAMGFGKK